MKTVFSYNQQARVNMKEMVLGMACGKDYDFALIPLLRFGMGVEICNVTERSYKIK